MCGGYERAELAVGLVFHRVVRASSWVWMMQAVRREVHEEVGVTVGEVKIVGSQPWPAGRGGSCELMIGVIACATTTDIVLNEEEVRNTCRWMHYQRAQLATIDLKAQLVRFSTSS